MQNIFSIKNECKNDIIVKVLTIFGIKIKIKNNGKKRISKDGYKWYTRRYPLCDICNIKIIDENNIKLPHPVGIVISRAAKLGRNLVIYQNVTIGAKSYEDGDFQKSENYPSIGDNTIIYAGAVIVGGITIGKNCVVGANSVITKDIPDNSICYGVNKIKEKK